MELLHEDVGESNTRASDLAEETPVAIIVETSIPLTSPTGITTPAAPIQTPDISELQDILDSTAIPSMDELPVGPESSSFPDEDGRIRLVEAKKTAKNRAKKARKKNKVQSTPLITFGPVEVITFNLDLGFDVVPGYGYSPLGLGQPINKKLYPNLEAYEQHLHSNQDAPSTPVTSKDSHTSAKYQPLSEAERIQLFCTYSSLQPDAHSHTITELNKELRSIRDTRNTTGCSCKKVKVDKLSAGKMRTELIAKGISSEIVQNMSKTELSEKLKQFGCLMCLTNDCECIVNGVPCMVDICGCIHKASTAQECGNVNGKVVFDAEAVHAFRNIMLQTVNSPATLKN